MTTCVGKSFSFSLPRVPFVGCCQFVCLAVSLLVLGTGCGVIVSVADRWLSLYFAYRTDIKKEKYLPVELQFPKKLLFLSRLHVFQHGLNV